MKEYKRLTNNNLEEYNPEYDFCMGCKYFGEPNGCNRPNGTCANYERFIETYNRLAELEDKIENGTLIELPCKVGNTVYVFNRKYEICEMEVISFMLTNKFKEFYAVVDNPYEHYGYSLYASKLNKDWFLTKAEAEAKLKELQSNE